MRSMETPQTLIFKEFIHNLVQMQQSQGQGQGCYGCLVNELKDQKLKVTGHEVYWCDKACQRKKCSKQNQ